VLKRFRYKFEDEKLAAMLQRELGATTTLGDEHLKTLLMLVMRNATTDSPWPVSNNPRAKYNGRQRPDCNLNLPLWQLVRASTAAPTYFPPETIEVGTHHFVFVDGGVTMYNNPAFQLFLMATLPEYQLAWPRGEDALLLVSVGTGAAANANADLVPGQMNLLYNAASIPSALMAAASIEQDLLCRVFGRALCGSPIDRELGDLLCKSDAPIRGDGAKQFTYVRYNADLSRAGLDALGLSGVEPSDVQKMDSVDHIAELGQVGSAVGQRDVRIAHFAGFLS
jgi:patatin-like phospholipase/acyl hydrolase